MNTKSIPCVIAIVLIMSCSNVPALAQSSIDLRALFEVAGGMNQVDPDLLAAIAQVESAGRTHAVSAKGAEGLMQLMPVTAKRFKASDPYDPIDNVLGAARFLAFLRSRFAAGGSDLSGLPQMLAAYDAGEAAVQKYGGIPPYDETREYVRKVLWMYLAGSIPPRPSPGWSNTPHPVLTRRPLGDLTVLEHLSRIRSARAHAFERDEVSIRR